MDPMSIFFTVMMCSIMLMFTLGFLYCCVFLIVAIYSLISGK